MNPVALSKLLNLLVDIVALPDQLLSLPTSDPAEPRTPEVAPPPSTHAKRVKREPDFPSPVVGPSKTAVKVEDF